MTFAIKALAEIGRDSKSTEEQQTLFAITQVLMKIQQDKEKAFIIKIHAHGQAQWDKHESSSEVIDAAIDYYQSNYGYVDELAHLMYKM